jgi:hypothetical protein
LPANPPHFSVKVGAGVVATGAAGTGVKPLFPPPPHPAAASTAINEALSLNCMVLSP